MTQNTSSDLFSKSDKARLFFCRPGQDFATSVAEGLHERLRDAPPAAMARVRIYANAERMRAQIVEAFHKAGPVFLPHVRLITDLPADYPIFDLPAPVPSMQRMLELRQLVAQLVQKNHLLAHKSAVPDLADTLTALIEEMSDEGVPPDAFDKLDVVEHSGYWDLSLKFLNIVTQFVGPASAEQPGPAEWLRRAATTIVRRWEQTPEQDPVLIVGSTGSRATTAMLIRAVSRLPQGAVILPGFDDYTPQGVLSELVQHPGAEEHPQFRFAKLLSDLDLEKTDVEPWFGQPDASQSARNALISLSLRPAPVTSQWMTEAPNLQNLDEATANMSLVLAPDPRREAVAIALAIRDAVEHDRSVALITPDKNLTRMVVTSLARWNIVADASMGQPLNQSVPGRLFRQALKTLGGPPETEALLSLLKHPLVSLGGKRGDHLNRTRALELQLRDKAVPVVEPHHVRTIFKDNDDTDLGAWVSWMCDVVLGSTLPEFAALETHLGRHVAHVEALCAGFIQGANPDELWRDDAGETLSAFLQELSSVAHHGGRMPFADYADLIENLLRGREVRNPVQPHPRVKIWGTQEARVKTTDLVILGGLNDGVWPDLPGADPWLNRDLRRHAGMVAPERKIGLAAHDYQQAVAAPEVILTRAKRDAEAETVPSRWLSRLLNLLKGLAPQHPDLLDNLQSRGQIWLARADLLERPENSIPPEPRPSVIVPVASRPRNVSISSVRKILDDPYAHYANKILRLRTIPPLFPKPDVRLRGNVVHKIVEVGLSRFDTKNDFSEELARFLEFAKQEFNSQVAWPEKAAHWISLFEGLAPDLLKAEIERRALGDIAATETPGRLRFEQVGMELNCKADRIDQLNDGTIAIFDYKTGKPPSQADIKKREKQLLLESVIAEHGGFKKIGPKTVSKVAYLGIWREQKPTEVEFNDGKVDQIRREAISFFEAYLSDQHGFLSRRFSDEKKVGDYDHLARFGEWSDSDAATDIDLS